MWEGILLITFQIEFCYPYASIFKVLEKPTSLSQSHKFSCCFLHYINICDLFEKSFPFLVRGLRGHMKMITLFYIVNGVMETS